MSSLFTWQGIRLLTQKSKNLNLIVALSSVSLLYKKI